MGDLISRSTAMKNYCNALCPKLQKCEYCNNCIVKAWLNNQPTAYDVDKVVERLEKKMQTHECCIEYEKKNGTITEEFQQRKAVEVLKDAIEIVKGGGIDA